MKKAQKSTVVEELTASFGRASIALVSEYRGMTAAESTEMRRRLRAVRGEMRVAKNTLVRRAIKGTAYEALDSKLGGQIGLILSYEDPVALAKTFTSFGPLGDKLKLRAAILDGKALTVEEVQALAKLPSREVIFLAVARGLECARNATGPAPQRARLVSGPSDRRDWKEKRRRRGDSGSRRSDRRSTSSNRSMQRRRRRLKVHHLSRQII